ncbi:CU044_5270 family protein [Nonomuraea sp. SYSU D8015]|uniref:CU044_5270 family protein n=1 Tax=Nonomuraea sp. SYSU D8015 TaxID=2593644 RepID=UPI001660D436|nr:CU044_5270 family protein [Nonomuraea sp. SYSU D8015]
MNDLDLVRGLYDEDPPPPDNKAMAQARARMLSQADTVRSRPRRAWRLPLGLVAAAMVTSVVAGMTLMANDPGDSRRPGETKGGVDPSTQTLSPRGMMLAAASQAERQPQGRYWFTHQRTGLPLLALGQTGGYVVEERSEAFEWTGRTRGDGQAFYGRDFAGRPQTDADVKAWRDAGSPRTWQVRSSGVTRTISTESGTWRADQNKHAGGAFNIPGVGSFTYAELQDLPTEPEELRKLLCEGRVRHTPEVAEQLGRGGIAGARKRCDGAFGVLNKVFFTLGNTPVPPKVRAGLMRLLTDYPGVRRLGTVTDPLGRTGVALATSYESRDGRGTIQRDLLFDQRTGKVLGSRDILQKPGPDSQAWQVPGRILGYWLILDSGWTDANPHLPD